MYPSERTPLASSQPGPPYVFMSNPHREYRKQIRQFQCCVCTTILAIFLSSLIITIIYSLDDDESDSTPTPPTNSSVQMLMQLSFPLKDDIPPGWSGPFPDNGQLLTAVQKGKQVTAKKADIEKNMPLMLKSSPTYRYRQAQKTSKEATKLAEYGHVMEEVTKQFSSISGNTAGRGPQVAFNVLDNPMCSEDNLRTCENARYRNIDGWCNHLNHSWGVAMKPFRRVLPPVYADGVSVPRLSSDNSSLPSAREVSLTIHRPEYRDDPKFTVMLAVWGQFLDHDLTATALSQGSNGEPISCCWENPQTAHPECMPVRITPEDPKYKDTGTDCLDFVRSAPAPSCTLGPREQLNQATSFLDASVVYGSDDNLSKKLRSYKKGKMLVSHSKDGKVLLPVSTDPNDGCNEEEENKKGRYCFIAGDPRSNENLHLTAMHLLFVRQHNIIAERLAAMNPDWDDEKIYQETRHIVAAQMQHITYNEFLPVILGPQMMTHLELQPQTSGYWDKYNSSVDPTIANNFAAASFRFAHTLLPGLMKIASQYADSYEAIELHKMLFNPYKLYTAGYVAQAIQGAMVTHLERADTYFTPELTEHLFEKETDNTTHQQKSGPKPGPPGKRPICGLDLVSLNIQRGRDHGLPTYPLWRKHCGFPQPKTFEDLRGVMDEESLKRMSSVYKSIDDVDLYTGSLSEVPIEGGLLGPTATCLLADQFKRLKDGDRYWYETSASPQKFSPAQLNEIRKTSLAGVICDTSDGVKESQRLVMQSVSPTNKRVSCNEIPRTNLGEWRPQYRKTVNITLVGGDIRTENEVAMWEGTLPVALTLPTYIGTEENPENFTFKVNDGVWWFSSSLRVEKGIIYVNGSFSAPEYDNLTNSVHWANGKFELKFRADSEFDWEAVQGQLISSPVYFKVVEKMKVPSPETELIPKKFLLQSSQKIILQDSPTVSKENFILQSSPSISHKTFILQQAPKEVKAPIFLEGKFSKDRTEFYWDGEAFLLMPSRTTTANPNQPQNEEDPYDDATFDRDWVIVSKSNPTKRESQPVQPDLPTHPEMNEIDSSEPNSVDSLSEPEHLSIAIKVPEVKIDSMQRFQLQYNPDSSNFTEKKESIPGHHMNESEADSEWELVPGTISDYRRKGSKSKNHLGPGEPPSNRNVLDDIIDERKNRTGHLIDLDPSSHVGEKVLKFRLKKSPVASSEDTSTEENNRLLIKVDPSIRLFPVEWSYDNTTGNRVIPVDYFYKVNVSTRTSKPIILWNAKLNGSTLVGNISIPEFVLTANGKKHVLWENTTFNLNFQTAAENIVQRFSANEGTIYNSRFIFKDVKCSDVENVSNNFETLEWQLDTFQKISLIQSGNSLPTSDIILLGEFNENKTAFNWDGSLMIRFDTPEEDNFEVAIKDVTSDWSAIPLKVTAVSFSMNSINGKPAPKGWSSLTPNYFPFAALAKNHITDVNSALLWMGHVEGDRLKGNFTLPLFEGSATSPHLLKGNFEMRLQANLPQLSRSNQKPGYTEPEPSEAPKDPRDPRNPGVVFIPHIDLWPPPPSYYPKTFPIPFPINITGSPSDPLRPNNINPVESSKGLNPLHLSQMDLSQKDSSKLIKTTPASPHLLLNTIPWPPVYPKWPANKSPPPWEQPYPFADSNSEPHPDEPMLKKKANVEINSKSTQTEWAENIKEKKPQEYKSMDEKLKRDVLLSSPVSTKQAVNDDIDKLTALYMKKLAAAIKPGIQYSTKLLIKSKYGVKYNTKRLNVSNEVASLLGNSVASKIVIDGAWKDDNAYYWPGDAVFLLAPPPTKLNLKKLGAPLGPSPYFQGSYAVHVVDGSVSIGDLFSATLWSGQMPLDISLPVSWASANISGGGSVSEGIHWIPTLVSYDRMEGNYYLDGFDNSNSSSPFTGSFSFAMYPVWTEITANKLFVPGTKFFSKVVFEPLPDWKKYATAPQNSDNPSDVDVEKHAPITIKGDFSENKTVFKWNGDAIIEIP